MVAYQNTLLTAYHPYGMGLFDNGLYNGGKRNRGGLISHRIHRGKGLYGGGFFDIIKGIFNFGKKAYEIAKPIYNAANKAGVIDLGKKVIGDLFNSGKEVIGNLKEKKYGEAFTGINKAIDNSGKTINDYLNKRSNATVRDILNHGKKVAQNEVKRDVAQTAIESTKQQILKQEANNLRDANRIESQIQVTSPNTDLSIPDTVIGQGRIRKILRKRNHKMVRRLIGSGLHQL